ncbi:unnamed protein product [Sphenostylis stenocarpa]|uniref:Uncharacterized protein n=1 Tax=Sphenostylis stenocarpa TaxID=92480 RepID=A0AA86W6H9_9FABA|nr:unnamed protein product [Sphenostylis stenocarpa]
MATRGGDSDDSWMVKTHKAVKKANNSVLGYVSSKSHWALSHGHIILRPPQPKSVEKIVSKGIDLFRHKKPLNIELVHQLRLLDNRFIQWRFANAKAGAVNHTMSLQAEGNLMCALDSIGKLRYSLVLTKIELQREKLEMKLDYILQSQVNEAIEDMGKYEKAIYRCNQLIARVFVCCCMQSSSFGRCKGGFETNIRFSVACIESNKFHEVNVIYFFTHGMFGNITLVLLLSGEDLKLKVKLKFLHNQADEIARLISELAEIVIQEKFLLQEFNDIFHTMCLLEDQLFRVSFRQEVVAIGHGPYIRVARGDALKSGHEAVKLMKAEQKSFVVELSQNMKSEIITAGPDIDFLINGFCNR